MLFQNLSSLFQPRRVVNATAAGVTVVNSSSVDMAGFKGVTFLVSLGTMTSTGIATVKAQQSNDDGSADDFSDIAGTLQTVTEAGGGSNKVVQLEIHKPTKRYVRIVITRTVANTVVDGAVALVHTPTISPPALHSTCAARKVLNAPPEGTA